MQGLRTIQLNQYGAVQTGTDERACPKLDQSDGIVRFHLYDFTNYCGAFVCRYCDEHLGMSYCYCGWKFGRENQVEYMNESNGEYPDEPCSNGNCSEDYC